MTISELQDELEEFTGDLEELTHVPQERKDAIRTMVEDVMEALDRMSEEFGDENLEDDGDEDDCFDD
jgi:hypothetical protein